MIFVTGGAGFIGSNFVLGWVGQQKSPVVTIDKLTYAGNILNLASLSDNPLHTFVRGDIGDRKLIAELFKRHKPRAVVHFAAESHVDRSILGPAEFIETNVVGTFNLLEEARIYWNSPACVLRDEFRFLHVSTDEVYGSLGPEDSPFSETTAYAPNSPYAASKAASDHLVRAYHHTYRLPTLTTNCSNNYGPYQFPEKLIPLIILNALQSKPLPVYGDGLNVRDWLFVDDHCAAIEAVLQRGKIGGTYNIGGSNEKTNLQVVQTICAILDQLVPRPDASPYAALVEFVKDRPGHDRRYAIDSRKTEREIGWRPAETFETGIEKTVQWYLDHRDWTQSVTSGAYQNWVKSNYQDRAAL